MSSGPALVLVEIQEMFDSDLLAQYQPAAREQSARRGGTTIARGGEVVDGDPSAVVWLVQRWPSGEEFAAWQDSEEYAPLKVLRQRAARMRLVMIAEIPRGHDGGEPT